MTDTILAECDFDEGEETSAQILRTPSGDIYVTISDLYCLGQARIHLYVWKRIAEWVAQNTRVATAHALASSRALLRQPDDPGDGDVDCTPCEVEPK